MLPRRRSVLHPGPAMLPRRRLVAALLTLGGLLGLFNPTAAQDLADDSRAYHLVTVTTDPPTPACARLQALLRDPAVAAIAAQTKRFDFRPSDAIYRTRYAEALPVADAPIVALVRWDGGVVFKASGPAIPSTAAGLAAELRRWALADRATQPQATPAAPYADPHRLAGDLPAQLLGGRRLIPDSVTISHRITVPPLVGYLIAAAVLLFMLTPAAGLAVLLLLLRLKDSQ